MTKSLHSISTYMIYVCVHDHNTIPIFTAWGVTRCNRFRYTQKQSVVFTMFIFVREYLHCWKLCVECTSMRPKVYLIYQKYVGGMKRKCQSNSFDRSHNSWWKILNWFVFCYEKSNRDIFDRNRILVLLVELNQLWHHPSRLYCDVWVREWENVLTYLYNYYHRIILQRSKYILIQYRLQFIVASNISLHFIDWWLLILHWLTILCSIIDWSNANIYRLITTFGC